MTILRLTPEEISVLRDALRDWLSQFKDDYPRSTTQRIQHIVDALDNPFETNVREVFRQVQVDYKKIGEVYSGE